MYWKGQHAVNINAMSQRQKGKRNGERKQNGTGKENTGKSNDQKNKKQDMVVFKKDIYKTAGKDESTYPEIKTKRKDKG